MLLFMDYYSYAVFQVTDMKIKVCVRGLAMLAMF